MAIKFSSAAEYKIIDPTRLTEADLPLIALCDNRNSMLGYIIKSHGKGTYNHAMWMHKPGKLASMDFNGFHEVPLSKYMKNNILLKFWGIDGLTDAQKQMLLLNIDIATKKERSWMAYDVLGLFGQWVGIPQIHNPFQKYCSEEVLALGKDPIFTPLKINIDPLASPSKLNAELTKNQPPFKVAGYWLQD
jgi:hypothetical protein